MNGAMMVVIGKGGDEERKFIGRSESWGSVSGREMRVRSG